MGYTQSKQWIDIAEKFSSKIREEKEKVIIPACMEVLTEYKNSLPHNSLALDFGGGDGLILSHLVPHNNFRWYYHDISLEQEKTFRKKNDLTNITILNDIDIKFNIIMCNHVVNCMENTSELETLFKKLYSLLLMKGMLIITINHPLYIHKKHRYYSCAATHLNYKDGSKLDTTIYDKVNEHLIFSDIYWSYDTILDVIGRTGFMCLRKKHINVPGWSYPSYLQLILTRSDA
ncbi:TPA: class I SAM-dependent methyltransferase [Escherichia coli]|nr:class I SAM-dependent methyltransferase [Escherichia coli]HBE6508695.1 class I SAM-dependent methyltransferase [Escherichia coli]